MDISEIRSLYPWLAGLWDSHNISIPENDFYSLGIVSNERCMVSGIKFSLDIYASTPTVIAAKPAVYDKDGSVMIVAKVVYDLLINYDMTTIKLLADNYTSLTKRMTEANSINLTSKRKEFYKAAKKDWLSQSFPESRILDKIHVDITPFNANNLRERRLAGTGAPYEVAKMQGRDVRMYKVIDFVRWLESIGIAWEYEPSYPTYLTYVTENTETYEDLILDIFSRQFDAQSEIKQNAAKTIADHKQHIHHLEKGIQARDEKIQELESLRTKVVTLDHLIESEDYRYLMNCVSRVERRVIDILDLADRSLKDILSATESDDAEITRKQISVICKIDDVLCHLKYALDERNLLDCGLLEDLSSDKADERLLKLVKSLSKEVVSMDEVTDRAERMKETLACRYAKQMFGIEIGDIIESGDGTMIAEQFSFSGDDLLIQTRKILKSGKPAKGTGYIFASSAKINLPANVHQPF